MSYNLEKEIMCRSCELMSKTIIYQNINAGKHREIRRRLMDSSLFLWECPHCGHHSYLSYPLLYSDLDLHFMIYLIPNGNYEHLSDLKLHSQYPQLENIKKRIVNTTEDLKEKILIFDSELDDMYMEVTKLILTDTVEKQISSKVLSCRFCVFDENTQSLGFAFFLKDREEPYLRSVRVSAYEKAADIVDEYLSKVNLPAGFLNVNAEWAERVMDVELSWE